MKRKNALVLTSLVTAASMCMTGCNLISQDVESYPLASTMSVAELQDYYKQSMQYDAIVSKNVTEHKPEYELVDISGERKTQLEQLTQQCEDILSSNEYEPTEESSKIMSLGNYEYIKGIIDNEVLTSGATQSVKGAVGYYFVTKRYSVSPKTPGTFKPSASLLGLNGSYYKDYNDNVKLDKSYMRVVCSKMNKYFKENAIAKKMQYSNSDNSLEIIEDASRKGEKVVDTTNDSDNDTVINNDNTVTNNDAVTDDSNSNEVNNNTESMGKSSKYQIMTPEDRRTTLDTKLINDVAGASLKQSGVMPELEEVYNIPSEEGDISGYGIYTAGADGLRTFGYNRSNLNGTIDITYVFKDDEEGSGEIIGVNAYCSNETINTEFSDTDNVLIPDFLKSQLEQIIDRADRVQVDYYLAGLCSCSIYEDIGVGVLRGYRESKTGIQKQMSKINRVVQRDTLNNSYLLDVETTVTEGSKDSDAYGTYRDRAYVVVQQQDSKFKITDWLRVSREIMADPLINPVSNAKKRIVALNLAGEIPDSTRTQINGLLSEWYTAGTNRQLSDFTLDDGTTNRGINHCISSDTTILDKDSKDYLVSSLADVITAHGVDVQSQYIGNVTEWIGGYNNQAEFTTEELITYADSKSEAYYAEVYYLVSLENDKWVIDERKVLDYRTTKNEEDANNIRERIGL